MKKLSHIALLVILLIFINVQPTFATHLGDGKEHPRFDDPNVGSGGSFGPDMIDQPFPAFMQSITTGTGLSLDEFAPTVGNRLINGGNLFIYGPDAFQTQAPGQARVGGTIGFFASNIEMMVRNKPASSMDYIAYMGNELRVPGTPEVAYAAGGGLGFNGLTPVLNIWVVMRNLAYFLFAIIFVVIGVMIMTRRKIDPKTVASIQNALPKVVFALIIVTFSYAIAGFLVDIMYVALALIVTIMGSIGGSTGGDFVKTLLSGSIFNFVFNGGFFAATFGVASTVAGIVNNITGAVGNPVSGNVVGFISGGLAFLIVGIAILVALFKTWLALIGAFAHIILAVIFAPLRLTLDAIPGQNQFSAWVKDLLANLLTFPLVTILLAIGAYISSYSTPAEVVGFTPPLLGAGNVREVLPFIGLGILLTIPKALDILREVLKAPAFKYGGAWAENISAGRAVTTAGLGGAWTIAQPIRSGIDQRMGLSATLKTYRKGVQDAFAGRGRPTPPPAPPVPGPSPVPPAPVPVP